MLCIGVFYFLLFSGTMWLGLGLGLGVRVRVSIRIRVWNIRAHASVASWCECMKISREYIVAVTSAIGATRPLMQHNVGATNEDTCVGLLGIA